MKIAIVSSGFLPVVDGVSTAVWHRLRQLSDRNHKVLLLCPDYSGLQHLYPNWRTCVGPILPNVRVVPLESGPALGLDFERDVKPRAYATVLRELQAFQPDIIHVDEPERLTCCFWKRPGVTYARKHQIPCVGFFHTNYIDYIEDYVRWPQVLMLAVQKLLRLLFKWIYNSYDATLVASGSTEQKIRDTGIDNAVQGRFLGFDAASYAVAQRVPHFFEQQYGLQGIEQTVRLIFVGRLTPDKGWDFTCRAFQQFAQRLELAQISLIVVGDGPLQDSLRQKLGAMVPHLYFLGRIAPQQMPALYANSDIHVTVSEKETTGLTVLEARAAGTPVLAPRTGGVVDHVDHEKNGLLFSPQDHNDFVEKLRVLIENPEIRQQMGAWGQAHVEQYGWDRSVETLLGVWQTLISQTAASASTKQP